VSEGKASPGQDFYPPPANLWNNMIDAGRAFADSRLNSPAGPPIRPRETDIIRIKNDSGAARRKGEILKIDGKAIETVTDEQIWLVGKAVTAECRFGIVKKPVEIDGVEALQVSGVCMALVDITDESHTFAEAADGEYVLQSGTTGSIEILHAPAGTGEKECVVRFAGGSGGSASEGNAPCPCECLETGDILVNGIATTSRWRVTLPIVTFEQANGGIRLAAGSYLVEWDAGLSLWVLDIGDSLTAFYNDGSDATADTTMDGEITLEWASLSDQPELKVCVTGTVPVP